MPDEYNDDVESVSTHGIGSIDVGYQPKFQQ